jgi:hypothetical protein
VDTTSLFAGMIAGTLGLGYFIYGKKQSEAVPMLCGFALMVYPYFFSNVWLLVSVGVALCVIPFVYRA